VKGHPSAKEGLTQASKSQNQTGLSLIFADNPEDHKMKDSAIAFLLCTFTLCATAPYAEAPILHASSPDIPVQDVWEPVLLGPRLGGVLLMPDGTLTRFVSVKTEGDAFRNSSIASSDGGKTWSEPRFEYEGPRAMLPLLDRDGEFHVFPMVVRRPEGRREIAVNYFIDILHVGSRDGRTAWSDAQRIFEGYVGSINCVTQLSNGRIIVPFASWIGGRPQGPPTGANVVTCVYSDDRGATWRQSPAALTAPCYTDFNGSGYGACEPVIMELKDGRIYMLARTETGRLYESYSTDGVNWEDLKPSRFLGTDAPAGFLRLPDDRILLFWNGCEKPPRADSAGVYGGRDAVHAAISSDECATWQGFREVYRDPTRNESPQRTGDRGTAYPMPYQGAHGKVIVLAGQGRSGGSLMFDPDWLLETHHEDDFSEGLGEWSVFKHFGPAERWWRDRVQGPVLIDHPSKPGAKALHVRRPDNKPGDGAVWNFPMGTKGKLTLRLLVQEGFGGATLALLDRFFNPTDARVDTEGVFTLPVQPDGHISIAKTLEPGAWQTLRFEWDLPQRTCVIHIDDEPAVYLKPAYRDPVGINYLHIRSTATEIDQAGLLIESVSVDVE
jgi:BNR repeat-like domain